uniref:Uncharacterized protein n=1 Tax=Onchocerca volvulus TaxID=6282 RepID=A0A2K6VE78_ONCVO
MNALLRDAVNTVEEARKSIDRQNEVNKAIETELSCFNNDVNREFNELCNRICKIRKDFKHRIEFFENMCKHYTDNLSHRINAFSLNETEVWQKLNKLEWNLIFLQCVGRSFIEASTSYLSEIHFDNIEETFHKTIKNLTGIDNILADNYNASLSPFTEVLQLVYNSVQNLRRLPCTLDGTMVGENMDQNNLLDEANKLLKMCANIQQKIMNVESTSKIGSSASSGTEAVLSEDDRIISTSDLNSNEEQ